MADMLVSAACPSCPFGLYIASYLSSIYRCYALAHMSSLRRPSISASAGSRETETRCYFNGLGGMSHSSVHTEEPRHFAQEKKVPIDEPAS
jgi:hypothetical protein